MISVQRARFGTLLLLVLVPCWAQQPAAPPAGNAHGAAPAEDLEPAVNTSAPSASEPKAPAPATGSAPPAKPASTAARAEAAPRTRAGHAMDRLQLDTTDITGNRELPKVLYIVPWHSSDLGDLVGKPVNSLVDEVLQPVDRDVFRRENRYYRALKPGPDGASGSAGAARNPADRP